MTEAAEKSVLMEKIVKLKEETDTLILAHYYQESEIQDIADFVGDSLDLARQAHQTSQKRILFCGVHFMAETAKILNPDKTVILPDLNAGCSLADSCPPGPFKEFKEKHPDHLVVSYINCSAETKALSDIIVTSSNAVKIVADLPKDQKVIFAPDKYLGSWVEKMTGRELVLWDGCCEVHEQFNLTALEEQMKQNPESKVIAHPECPQAILEKADFVGSTKKLLDYVGTNSAQTFIVVTEPGILHKMMQDQPEKNFLPAKKDSDACNKCPHMRLNTLEKVYDAMMNNEPQIHMEESLRLAAQKPLMVMLERS